MSVLLVGLLTPSAEVEAISYTLRVDDPNGGEIIYGGSVFVIRLYTSSSGGVLVVSFSTDGGETYPNEVITSPNGGGTVLIDWYVPNNVDSTAARVKAEWRSESGPDETLTIYPSNWLDLEAAEVIIEREDGNNGFDLMLLALIVGILVVAAAVIWFLVVRRKGRKD